MSELATIARPYAEAVFNRARETDSLEKWSDMLAFLSAVISDQGIALIIDNPKINKDRFNQFIQDLVQGQVNDEGANFLKLLVHNNRLNVLPQISEIYANYKSDHEGYIEVELLSAYVLSKEEQEKLAATLEKLFTKKVHLHISVDKSLIGGVYVRAGDQVIDGSIKGQLQQLAKQL